MADAAPLGGRHAVVMLLNARTGALHVRETGLTIDPCLRRAALVPGPAVGLVAWRAEAAGFALTAWFVDAGPIWQATLSLARPDLGFETAVREHEAWVDAALCWSLSGEPTDGGTYLGPVRVLPWGRVQVVADARATRIVIGYDGTPAQRESRRVLGRLVLSAA